MAHNNRIRLTGFWTSGSVILPAEMEALDQAQYEEVNGDRGGTWAPLSQIILGGQGLRVTGPSKLDDADVTITMGKALTVNSSANLNLLAGSTTVMLGLASLGGALLVTGSGVIVISTHGGLSVNGTGEEWVQPSGIIRLLQAPGFGGGSVVVEGGAGMSFVGAPGNKSWLLAASSAWGFGAGFVAEWASSSLAEFLTGSELRVNSVLTLSAGSLVNCVASMQFTGFPLFSGVTTFTGGAEFNCNSTIDATRSVIFASGSFIAGHPTLLNSASFTTQAGSQVVFGGEVDLTAAQPGGTSGIGLNRLNAIQTCKAWAVLIVDGSGGVDIVDGFNIQDAFAAAKSIVISFVDHFQTGNYVVVGSFMGPDPDGTINGSGVVLAKQATPDGFVLVVPNSPNVADQYDFSTAGGRGKIVFSVWGRQ